MRRRRPLGSSGPHRVAASRPTPGSRRSTSRTWRRHRYRSPAADRPLDPATEYLLDNDDFATHKLPTSPGGAQRGNPEATATFGDGSQVDYALPSPDLTFRRSSVVWPSDDANKRGLGDDVEAASDHRLVWADLASK